jgi:hypothetical protein
MADQVAYLGCFLRPGSDAGVRHASQRRCRDARVVQGSATCGGDLPLDAVSDADPRLRPPNRLSPEQKLLSRCRTWMPAHA